MDIKKIVDSYPRRRATGGVSGDKIMSAENVLGLHFAPEYRELLIHYGSLFLKGEEFLGIEVADITLRVREEHSDFPQDMYVISNTYIDGVLLVQDRKGTIYTYQPKGGSQKIADSLSEYISSL